jgi:hypothetical protein
MILVGTDHPCLRVGCHIELHEVEATAPIHESFGEPSHPDQRVDYEGKPSRLGYIVRVIRLIKSDWGLELVMVLRRNKAYGADRPTYKFELMSGLVGSGPTIDRHDRLFFREMCDDLSRQVTFGLLALGKSPLGHIVLHHGAFFKLVPDGVHMVGTGHLEKFHEVIGRLTRMTLEVTRDDGNEILIGIVSLLFVVTLLVSVSDCGPLGSLLWAPLVAFGAPICTFVDCLEWCPSTATRDHPTVTLDENIPDSLLTRGIPSGDDDQLLHGLWLIAVVLMH